MPERRALMERIKATEREYLAVAHAVVRQKALVQAGESELPSQVTLRDLDAAAEQLQPTYLVRMWAEFETALRSFWRHKSSAGSEDTIGTRNLIDWVAGVKQGRAISDGIRHDVHEVRVYRNILVHERDDPEPPAAIKIKEARRRLNIYLQRLPESW